MTKQHVSHEGTVVDVPDSANIHETAWLYEGAVIGENVTIGQYCVVGHNAVIGDGSKLCDQAAVCHNVTLGKNVWVTVKGLVSGDLPDGIYWYITQDSYEAQQKAIAEGKEASSEIDSDVGP